ncbi:MAG TPA: hypothetical protein VHC69_05085 [Polyangiaceae bacterium]|nr:hypothetical protein [Polyangiaceae bacterium]
MSVAFVLGFAFASLAANARAQNTPSPQVPPADKSATAEAPHEPAINTVPPNTEAAIFGGKHQLAISSDAGFYISNTTVSNGGGSTTSILLQPAVDYFVIDHLSVGGFLLLNYQHTKGSHSTTFGIGPRVGYDIPLSSFFSIWPKVGLSFSSVTGPGPDANNLALNLFVPLMLHPAPHFFLGFGPALDVDLTGNQTKSTTIAGRLTIGGWL